MEKKMPVTPRAAQSTAKTDVVTRVSAEAVSRRAYSLFLARGGSMDMTSKIGFWPKLS